MAEATAVAKGRPTVLGVDDDTLNMFSTLTTSVESLSDGMMADLGVTIIGIEGKRGGEELESKTKPGEYYTTQDQMIIHLRVDDAFEKGFETGDIQWYLNLPREVEKDGQRSRADPGRQSDYGVFLTDLEALGVSANPANAAFFHFESVKDLVGLHFRRIQRAVEQRDGTSRRQFRAEDLYGIDNDVRTELGLPPAYIKGQEPAGKRGAAASA
jgi:hypothetical protein